MILSEELIKLVLTFIGGYCLWWLTLRRARLIYFLSGFASCQIPTGTGSAVVWIYQITIQNTGKAPARNVRVAHFQMPLHWQVIQTINYAVEQINGQDRIIHFPTIEPGMLVTISYLDTNYTNLTTAHDHVRSEEGLIRPTPVQMRPVHSKPVQYFLFILLVLGIYAGVSLIYQLIRWLWPIIFTSPNNG